MFSPSFVLVFDTQAGLSDLSALAGTARSRLIRLIYADRFAADTLSAERPRSGLLPGFEKCAILTSY